ncbi:MAG: tyrosine-type recombinase/integrase, partial [Bacillota bacterium]
PLKNALHGVHSRLLQKADGEIMTQAAWKRKWQSFIVALETDFNGCHKRWYGKKKDQKDIELPLWKTLNIRSHDLRHSFCTMLYDADVDIKTAMKWMGHADEKMILKVYAHLTEQKEKEAAQAVGKHINNVMRGQNGGQ